MSEINKRTISGLFLLTLLTLCFLYSFVLIISLIIISTVSWIEFSMVPTLQFAKAGIYLSDYSILSEINPLTDTSCEFLY